MYSIVIIYNNYDLKLRRYCCRLRVMTYKEQVKEILPIPKDS